MLYKGGDTLATSKKGREKHDPAVIKILDNKKLTYDAWSDEVLWKLFHDSLTNKNSLFRKEALRYAEQKLKDDAIEEMYQ